VSTAGATLAFKAEGAATVDAAVAMAQPVVPVYAAAGSFEMSFEVAQDYPGLINQVVTGFNSAYLDMVSSYTAVGSGSSVPTGLFTAMSNQTTSPAHVKVTSAGTLAANDVRATFGALAPRYQLNASWLMSPSMLQAVAGLAAPSVSNGLAPHDYAPASQGQPARLLGRPVLVSSYAPAFSNSTSSGVNWMVCGDLTRYLVVNRLGTVQLELIPNIPDMSTGRPTGQRSYYYMNRWGAGPTDLQAFRILSNS
jgi:HK97 family phage major capsid protein